MISTQMSGFSLTWITSTQSWKYLNYDGLWEDRKFPDENQCFDWIKSIHWYQLVNNGWLADVAGDFTCLTIICKNENTMRRHG